jgi:hypothetical protein
MESSATHLEDAYIKAYWEQLQAMPFAMAYARIREYSTTNMLRSLYAKYAMFQSVPFETIANLLGQFDARKIERSLKYLLTREAREMLFAVFEHPAEDETILPSAEHLFITFDTPLATAFGNVKALFFTHTVDDRILLPLCPHEEPARSIILQAYAESKPYYGLEVLREDYRLLYDFTYDSVNKQWVYPSSHLCPTRTCTSPRADSLFSPTHPLKHRITPCAACQEALAYWRSILYTVQQMIAMKYAVVRHPRPFEQRQQTYTSIDEVTVGKGKNRRRIKQEREHMFEYTLVTYDVSQKTVREQQEEQEELHMLHQQGKRVSWFALHGKEAIIYEKKHIAPYERRFRVRAGTYRVGGEEGFERYVPRLATVLHKTTAKAFSKPATHPSATCEKNP